MGDPTKAPTTRSYKFLKNIFYETFVNVLPQDANCVIKNVIREGYGEFLKEGLAEDQLKQRLDVSLDRWLHHPLILAFGGRGIDVSRLTSV